MASTSQSREIRLDMIALSSMNERGHIMSIVSAASDCLPICSRRQQSPQPSSSSSPYRNNLAKPILGLTFQAIVALFVSPPNSFPPLLTLFFGASALTSFALSFASLSLQNAFPRAARLFEKIAALIAVLGVCAISSFLIAHQNFAWVCWLAVFFSRFFLPSPSTCDGKKDEQKATEDDATEKAKGKWRRSPLCKVEGEGKKMEKETGGGKMKVRRRREKEIF